MDNWTFMGAHVSNVLTLTVSSFIYIPPMFFFHQRTHGMQQPWGVYLHLYKLNSQFSTNLLQRLCSDMMPCSTPLQHI